MAASGNSSRLPLFADDRLDLVFQRVEDLFLAHGADDLAFAEDDTFANAKVSAFIDTDSIFTNNADRDTHLKSAEFFNAEANPKITFEASTLNGDVTGNLTLNGITKPVTLDVDFGGINSDPWGNTKAGFSFEGKIKRSDFGLTWNAALETGGVMVSEDVKIAGELQFVKQ